MSSKNEAVQQGQEPSALSIISAYVAALASPLSFFFPPSEPALSAMVGSQSS